MWVLPHEPSNGREKANQDSVSSRGGSCSWQVGWEEFCWRRPSQEHGVPQCLRWGENPELENSSHLPGWGMATSQGRRGHPSDCCSQETKSQLLFPGMLLGISCGLSILNTARDFSPKSLPSFLSIHSGVLEITACKKHSLSQILFLPPSPEGMKWGLVPHCLFGNAAKDIT